MPMSGRRRSRTRTGYSGSQCDRVPLRGGLGGGLRSEPTEGDRSRAQRASSGPSGPGPEIHSDFDDLEIFHAICSGCGAAILIARGHDQVLEDFEQMVELVMAPGPPRCGCCERPERDAD